MSLKNSLEKFQQQTGILLMENLNKAPDDVFLARRARIHLKPPGQAKSASRRSVVSDARLVLITWRSLVRVQPPQPVKDAPYP